MNVQLAEADEWELLRAIARCIHGSAQDAEPDVERMANRLAAYVRSGDLCIASVGDVFGVADGSSWVILDFDDGNDPICIPLTRAQPLGPSAGTT